MDAATEVNALLAHLRRRKLKDPEAVALLMATIADTIRAGSADSEEMGLKIAYVEHEMRKRVGLETGNCAH